MYILLLFYNVSFLCVKTDGASTNPTLNTPLRQAIEDALKKNMPNSTIQNILKKASAQQSSTGSRLKKHFIEARISNKISLVCIVYTDNFPGCRQTIASLFRKNGAQATEIRHMFTEKGVIDCTLHTKIDATEGALEEICTEHAIETGAEEIEIVNSELRNVMVRLI